MMRIHPWTLFILALQTAWAQPPPAPGPVPAREGEIVIGKGTSRLCGDDSDSNWMPYDEFSEYQEYALHIDVDTSMCGFTGLNGDMPQYVATLMDDKGQGNSPYIGKLAGTAAIVRAAPTRFRVVVWDPTKTASELLQVAHQTGWKLSWVGGVGPMTGYTKGGKTGWKHSKRPGTIYVDVDTTSMGLAQLQQKFQREAHKDPVPAYPVARYFTSIHGLPSFQGIAHWRTEGANVVYSPTASGFRVYVTLLQLKNTADGYVLPDARMAQKAEDYEWTIGFISSPTDSRVVGGMSGNSGVGYTGGDAGEGGSRWQTQGGHGSSNGVAVGGLGGAGGAGSIVSSSLFTAVTTRHDNANMQHKPSYAVSLSVVAMGEEGGMQEDAKEANWRMAGNPILGHATGSGFELYLGLLVSGKAKQKEVLELDYARKHWRVNYIMFQAPENVEIVTMTARLQGADMDRLAFTLDRRTQLQAGIASVLHIAPADVFLLPPKPDNTAKTSTLLVPVEIKVPSRTAGGLVLQKIHRPTFGLELQKAMELNGRGSFVVQANQFQALGGKTEMIALYHSTHGSGSKYEIYSFIGAFAVIAGFAAHWHFGFGKEIGDATSPRRSKPGEGGYNRVQQADHDEVDMPNMDELARSRLRKVSSAGESKGKGEGVKKKRALDTSFITQERPHRRSSERKAALASSDRKNRVEKFSDATAIWLDKWDSNNAGEASTNENSSPPPAPRKDVDEENEETLFQWINAESAAVAEEVEQRIREEDDLFAWIASSSTSIEPNSPQTVQQPEQPASPQKTVAPARKNTGMQEEIDAMRSRLENLDIRRRGTQPVVAIASPQTVARRATESDVPSIVQSQTEKITSYRKCSLQDLQHSCQEIADHTTSDGRLVSGDAVHEQDKAFDVLQIAIRRLRTHQDIGLELDQQVEADRTAIVVTSMDVSSPAEQAGLLVHDRIVGIDRMDANQLGLRKLQAHMKSRKFTVLTVMRPIVH